MPLVTDTVALQASATAREAAAKVRHHPYSRYPVFGDSPDDVSGFVLGRDILEALTDGKAQELVSAICRDILKVPPEMRSDELLVLFRKKHVHLAVVQDSKHTVGLVTLEDVLEELVGEIEDEKDDRKGPGR